MSSIKNENFLLCGKLGEQVLEVVFGDGKVVGGPMFVHHIDNESEQLPALRLSHKAEYETEPKQLCIALIFKKRECVEIFREWLGVVEEQFEAIEKEKLEEAFKNK